MVRPAPAIEAIPATTPFVGPEQLMRERGLTQLVRLGANESAFGTSPSALSAMAAELPHLAWYGDPESYELRVELARRHGVAPERIVVTSGIDDAMGLVVRAFMPPGGVALTTRGSYPTFNYHVTGYGGTLTYASYRPSGALDFDELIATARRTRPSVVYVANPDNPSGTFATAAELSAFYDALPGDSLLLLDEAYADFVEGDQLMPDAGDDRLIRTRTFSKAYGMAGARIGYAIMSQRNASVLQKVRLHFGVNRNAQIGALASVRDEAFHRSVVAAVAAGRDAYYRAAGNLGLTTIASCTNFVCFDLGSASRANAVMDALLDRGVWVRKPGAPPLDGHIRVSVGTAPMREAFVAALRALLDGDAA